jgi:hypothetical protein
MEMLAQQPPGNYRFQGRAIPPGFVMGERDAQQLPPLPPGFVLEGSPQGASPGLPPLGPRVLLEAALCRKKAPRESVVGRPSSDAALKVTAMRDAGR